MIVKIKDLQTIYGGGVLPPVPLSDDTTVHGSWVNRDIRIPQEVITANSRINLSLYNHETVYDVHFDVGQQVTYTIEMSVDVAYPYRLKVVSPSKLVTTYYALYITDLGAAPFTLPTYGYIRTVTMRNLYMQPSVVNGGYTYNSVKYWYSLMKIPFQPSTLSDFDTLDYSGEICVLYDRTMFSVDELATIPSYINQCLKVTTTDGDGIVNCTYYQIIVDAGMSHGIFSVPNYSNRIGYLLYGGVFVPITQQISSMAVSYTLYSKPSKQSLIDHLIASSIPYYVFVDAQANIDTSFSSMICNTYQSSQWNATVDDYGFSTDAVRYAHKTIMSLLSTRILSYQTSISNYEAFKYSKLWCDYIVSGKDKTLLYQAGVASVAPDASAASMEAYLKGQFEKDTANLYFWSNIFFSPDCQFCMDRLAYIMSVKRNNTMSYSLGLEVMQAMYVMFDILRAYLDRTAYIYSNEMFTSVSPVFSSNIDSLYASSNSVIGSWHDWIAS